VPIETAIGQTQTRRHFHLLDCPIGSQHERHERIGQGSISLEAGDKGGQKSSIHALVTAGPVTAACARNWKYFGDESVRVAYTVPAELRSE